MSSAENKYLVGAQINPDGTLDTSRAVEWINHPQIDVQAQNTREAASTVLSTEKPKSGTFEEVVFDFEYDELPRVEQEANSQPNSERLQKQLEGLRFLQLLITDFYRSEFAKNVVLEQDNGPYRYTSALNEDFESALRQFFDHRDSIIAENLKMNGANTQFWLDEREKLVAAERELMQRLEKSKQ